MAVSATVAPGVVLSENEEVTISKLNALGTPTVNIEGAVGTLSLADGSVTNAKVATGAAIQHDKLATLSTGQLIVGNAGTPTAATVSGDVTIAADGAATVTDNAITPAKMEDGTQGDVLVYGASGAPERLGTGTSGQVLTAGGVGATPSWSTTQTIGFTSNQGTPTTTSLGSSYTHWGTCTLTLPADKTWLWVKVVVSFWVDHSKIVEQDDFKITTNSDGTTLLDTQQTDAGWVSVDSRCQARDNYGSITSTRIAEGVPTGHTTDTTLDLKVYMVGGSGGDHTSYRTLYAVGQYA